MDGSPYTVSSGGTLVIAEPGNTGDGFTVLASIPDASRAQVVASASQPVTYDAWLAINSYLTGASGGAGTGPSASGSMATADFSTATGRTVPATLWGFGTAGLTNYNFQRCTNTAFVNSAASLNLALLRINCNSGVGSTGADYWTDAVFRNGSGNPDWSVMNSFFAVAYQFIPATAKLIVGMKFVGSNCYTGPSDFGAACAAMVTHFANTQSGGRILPLWGIKIDNETITTCDLGTYCTWFNAAADAIHAVNPAINVIGPVDQYVDGGGSRMNTFGTNCGTRAGLACYHNYLYERNSDPTPTQQNYFTSTRPASDATTARSGLSTTAGSNAPLMMGEYYMDGNVGSDPYQPTTTGPPFVAQWLLNGFQTTANVQVGAVWELCQDDTYAAVDDNGTIYPHGYFLSKAGQVMSGTEANTTFSGNYLHSMAVQSSGHVGVMLVNCDISNAHSGTVGFSKWSLNSTGTATLNRWEISDAHPQGNLTTISVTAGVSASTTVPAKSVVILYV